MAALVERYPFTVRAGRVVRQLRLEVTITGMGLAKARTWLGVQVLALAARIIGCQLHVDLQGPDGPREPAPPPSLAVPPVRLSVSDLDRADAPVRWSDAMRIRVFLDGAEQREVIAYDCEAGTVERFVRDKRGERVLTPDGKAIARETVHGLVTVEYREAA